MRVAILGNSHVAALKSAWDRISTSHPELELVFYASRGDRMRDLIQRNGRLEPENEELEAVLRHTTGGRTVLNPEDYDAHLVYGLGLKALALPADIYSDGVIRQTISDATTCSLNYSLVRRLRLVTEAPVFVAANPLLAVRRNSPRVDANVYALNLEVMREVFGTIGATILAQPRSTIVRGFFTKTAFSQGSTRLEVGDAISGKAHPKADHRHKNAAYGILALKEFIERDLAGVRAETPISGGSPWLQRLFGWTKNRAPLIPSIEPRVVSGDGRPESGA